MGPIALSNFFKADKNWPGLLLEPIAEAVPLRGRQNNPVLNLQALRPMTRSETRPIAYGCGTRCMAPVLALNRNSVLMAAIIRAMVSWRPLRGAFSSLVLTT